MFWIQLCINALWLTVYILAAFFIVGVIPYAAYLIREELVEWGNNRQNTKARHRYGMAGANSLAQELVEKARLFEEQNFPQLAIARSEWAF